MSFLSEDPLGDVDSPNLYQYGLNSPFNYSDPLGLYVGTQAEIDEGLKLQQQQWEKLSPEEKARRRAESAAMWAEARRTFRDMASGALKFLPALFADVGCRAMGRNPHVHDCGQYGAPEFKNKEEVAGAFVGGLMVGLGPKAKSRPPTSGETPATISGKAVHKALAAERRSSGEWDVVNRPIKDAEGNPILVEKRVDLRSGKPVEESGLQTANPDAASFSRRLLLDDKPLGRDVMKDRQEFIRLIRAWEQREGSLPETIAIQRYDPATGRPVRTDLYKPSDFLPGDGK